MAYLTSLVPSRPAYLAAAIALAGLWALPAQAQSLTYDTRVLSGGQVPGSGPFGLTSSYRDVFEGSINNHGEIAFSADVLRPVLIGQPAVTAREVWSDGAGSIGNPSRIVRIGDVVVGAPTGVTYFGFGTPTITDAGNVGFTGRRSDMPFAQDVAIYGGQSLFMTSVSDPGQARVVLTAADEPVAALGGESISSIRGVRFDSDGGFNGAFGFDVAFSGVRDEPINSVIVSGDADGISRVIAAPYIDTLPTLPPADVLRNPVPEFVHRSNPRGEVAFHQQVLRDGLFTQSEAALFSEAAGSVGNPVEIVRANDPLPQLGPDLVVNKINLNISVNDAGQHAYFVSYGPAGNNGPAQGSAIFSETIGSPGAPGVVHRTGDLIAGTLDTAFDFAFTFLEVSAGGHVAISGVTVANSASRGVWLHGPEASSELELVYLLRRNQDDIRERGYLNDDPFNGPEGPILFENRVSSFQLNARGQVAFFVNLSTDEDSMGDHLVGGTIYATDLDGNVQIIARTGNLFDVNDDPILEDLRTFDQVTLNGFNDRNEILFHATFTDGSSGLFVATVPEPGSLALLGLGGLLLTRRRR